MDLATYFKAILSLAFVLGLVGLVAYLFRKFLFDRAFTGQNGKEKRLKIEESLFIDPKRRLILIKRDDVNHLILLNGNNDLLIESNIKDKK